MIHSLQNAYEMASKDDAGNPSFMDHFSCKICLEILNQPVQCQRNEHYYCTLCITKHLEQSHTCPLCQEELTVETLRPVPRVVAEVVSQFKIPRCNNVHRGCKEVVKPEDLPLHHEVCCFAPVVCSNEGCGETVNRQDQSSHENESCKFRKVKCEVCEEEMPYRDYEMHRCFMRKEMNEVKSYLTELKGCLKEFQEQLNINSQFIKDLQNPLKNVNPSSLIFIAGGHDTQTHQTFEIFNWGTKTWTLYKDALFFPHYYSFSFPYKKVIMVGGGERSNRIEYLNIKEDPTTALAFPMSLPEYYYGKAVLCGCRLLSFHGVGVQEVVLESPRSSKNILSLADQVCYYGAECVNEKVIVLGGGKYERGYWTGSAKVQLYDPVSNTVKELAPLPYKVSKMATVTYKDSIIILGGEDESHSQRPLNSVIMYNVSTKACKRLPSMLEKRCGCAAAILEDVIVVMGGKSDSALKTAEYLVLGQDSWNELPAMHLAREGATASVQV